MKSTYLTLALSIVFVIVVGLLVTDTLSSSSHQQASSTPDQTQQADNPGAASTTATLSDQQNATSSTATSTNDTSQSSNSYTRVAPSEATHIEVINSCGHNYQGGCLNVRSGPSTSNNIVAQLRNNIVLKVAATEELNGRIWYQIVFDEWLRYPDRVSGDWWVAGEFVRPLQAEAKTTDTPEEIETDKRIVVDLSEQKLYAYEGDELFMEEAVSTGNILYPTPRGTFPIYKMTPTRYMQGPIEGITNQDYDLPGVPWDLYFTYQGAVIHGAYWHNNFGQAWSNGCVNLPPAEAEKLYRWAELGTTVTVQD